MLIEIPDPEVILGVILAFLVGLAGLYGYYKVRPFIKSRNEVIDASQSERLEFFEKQIIDMKINDKQSSIIINMIKFFKIFIISIIFSLLIDFFFGKLILKKLDKFLLKTEFYERLIRINYPVYHHTLSPNIDYRHAISILMERGDNFITFKAIVCLHWLSIPRDMGGCFLEGEGWAFLFRV